MYIHLADFCSGKIHILKIACYKKTDTGTCIIIECLFLYVLGKHGVFVNKLYISKRFCCLHESKYYTGNYTFKKRSGREGSFLHQNYYRLNNIRLLLPTNVTPIGKLAFLSQPVLSHTNLHTHSFIYKQPNSTCIYLPRRQPFKTANPLVAFSYEEHYNSLVPPT